MDEGKKPEASGEEVARLGPYQLQEQVSQSDDSQGECYRATHETDRAGALVRQRTAEEDSAQRRELRVLFTSSPAQGYDAMKVEDTPWSVAPDRQSVESLLFTLEELHAAVRRMIHAVSGTREPRPRSRLGPALASTVAMGVLIFALMQLTSGSPPPRGSEPVTDTPPLFTGDDSQESAGTPYDPFASGALVDTLDAGDSVIARPLPREPFKGQKRPPCNRHAEVELIGACWTPHKLKAPCPDVLYEHQGECYVPNFSAKPPPQSVGQ
ncbi:hypothetical protein [Archangium sp.]|uniref:hypothetical protein n=1 Tax=Archangium sp. TaxID=1872627 RepID=UPI00286C43CD|nr:hypothetical protein [Archangium sp.]